MWDSMPVRPGSRPEPKADALTTALPRRPPDQPSNSQISSLPSDSRVLVALAVVVGMERILPPGLLRPSGLRPWLTHPLLLPEDLFRMIRFYIHPLPGQC